MWEYLRATSPFTKKGRRCNLNRFMGIVERPEALLPDWGRDVFERTYVALELDMLRGRKLEERIRVREGPPADRQGGEALGPTGEALGSTVEDRTLRSCCANAVGISVMLLSDVRNKRTVESVLASATPLRGWHCHQSTELRGYEVSEVAHIAGGWRVLRSHEPGMSQLA